MDIDLGVVDRTEDGGANRVRLEGLRADRDQREVGTGDVLPAAEFLHVERDVLGPGAHALGAGERHLGTVQEHDPDQPEEHPGDPGGHRQREGGGHARHGRERHGRPHAEVGRGHREPELNGVQDHLHRREGEHRERHLRDARAIELPLPRERANAVEQRCHRQDEPEHDQIEAEPRGAEEHQREDADPDDPRVALEPPLHGLEVLVLGRDRAAVAQRIRAEREHPERRGGQRSREEEPEAQALETCRLHAQALERRRRAAAEEAGREPCGAPPLGGRSVLRPRRFLLTGADPLRDTFAKGGGVGPAPVEEAEEFVLADRRGMLCVRCVVHVIFLAFAHRSRPPSSGSSRLSASRCSSFRALRSRCSTAFSVRPRSAATSRFEVGSR